MKKEEVFKQAIIINNIKNKDEVGSYDLIKHLEKDIWPRIIIGLDALKSRGVVYVDDPKTTPAFILNDSDPIQLRINYNTKTDEQDFPQDFLDVRKAMIANQASNLVNYEYIDNFVDGTSEKVVASKDKQPKDPINIYFGPESKYIRSVVESMVKEEGIPVVGKL